MKHHTIAKALPASQGESEHEMVIEHLRALEAKGIRTRVLGVCQDGPAEITRVWFNGLPLKGDVVRIRHNIGGIGQRQNMDTSPNGPIGTANLWIETEVEWCIYKVIEYRTDPMGVVCDLQYMHSVNL